LFIDLDGFKTVNDSLGHSAGDQMLTVVSERIASCLRASDTAARLGGDEFAVLIDDLTSPEDASGVAHRILGALRAPISLDSTQVVPAASIGIAYGEAGMAVDDLLRNADLAMYTAKSAGKNCVRVFADEMHLAAVERLDLESRLRGAADRGELVVHYQPIVELATGRIVSMEALVRWVHPERGLLSPGAFVSFAEESGLIHEIGHHVLVTAAARAASWQELVGVEASPSISVNLSPRQLLAATIVDDVAECVRSSGLVPQRLLLEITESALMADPRVAAERLARLRDLGVRLAVDDFGTGYSSLSYLRDFPVDVLKIDGSFIDDQLSAPGSLTRVILQIADALGLDAVAEGIETEEQSQELQSLGCVLGQGYHLGRPMEADAADRMVKERNGDRSPAA
jgi:diguanylate cyclase (GGDEF)-like protein